MNQTERLYHDAAQRCGRDITWKFIKESGTLRLSGRGKTEDYAHYESDWCRTEQERPWEEFLRRIRVIEVGAGVTGLGDRIFSNCPNLKAVILPKGLKRIGRSAFENCGALEAVVIPEGTVLIDDDAFHCCHGLRALSLPESLERIGDFAFAECAGLRHVAVPQGVQEIGEYAFIDEAL